VHFAAGLALEADREIRRDRADAGPPLFENTVTTPRVVAPPCFFVFWRDTRSTASRSAPRSNGRRSTS
jgi:hypothetical protein